MLVSLGHAIHVCVHYTVYMYMYVRIYITIFTCRFSARKSKPIAAVAMHVERGECVAYMYIVRVE